MATHGVCLIVLLLTLWNGTLHLLGGVVRRLAAVFVILHAGWVALTCARSPAKASAHVVMTQMQVATHTVWCDEVSDRSSQRVCLWFIVVLVSYTHWVQLPC